MSDATLLMLLNDVRGKTLRLLDGVSEEEARFAPPGLSNTIVWHAGHVLVVTEHLGVTKASGAKPSYPGGWFEMFSWQSKPTPVTHWPALADVVTDLRAQQVRFAAAIGGMTNEQLERALDGGTVRHSIVHGLHDEACHQGEIWLLRKLWKHRR